MSLLGVIKEILPLSPEVLELVGVTIRAVKQRDPDLAAQYARRAALRASFDFAQKAKRKEL
jgi:hypothetical protein